MSFYNTHSVSDTDSDSTLPPDDLVQNDSPDLFDDVTSDSKPVKLSNGLNTKTMSGQMVRGVKDHPDVRPLKKTQSKTHDLSDSDSESERQKNTHPLTSSITLKKRKSESGSNSPKKKLKSSHDVIHFRTESKTSIFSKHKKSPDKKDSSFSSEKHRSDISKQSSGESHSLKKVPSGIHNVSYSDSDCEQTQSKLKTKQSTSSPPHSNLTPKFKKVCEYGSRCFRKNPTHLAEFSHSVDGPLAGSFKKKDTSRKFGLKKTGLEIFQENQPLSFYMTKVKGIDDVYNSHGAIDIKDILSPSMGKLEASCQFNYMFEIDWLMKQYPSEFRTKPLTLVHGEQRAGLAALLAETGPHSNITCCQAKLEILYGTHHTKMMLLLYDDGLRVVIHTSNLIERDWFQKSQGVWISPVFPKLSATTGGSAPSSAASGARVNGDSPTHFKRDLLDYITAYRAHRLTVWENHIKAHDMSAAKVFIIASVPGRHTDRKASWGHLRLRKVLQNQGPDGSRVKSWPVIGQFSSIGSLGPTADTWVFKEWLQSLSASRGLGGLVPAPTLNLVFPSVNNVRCSLEGYPGGGCIPYSINTAKKQVYIHQHFRQWKSDGRGRSCACPHIKTYIRPSPDFKKAAWFLVTSANLSKAAWGAFEKNCSQLMIRSYELGVLFLPENFGCDLFTVTSDAEEAIAQRDQPVFPLPYDLPLTPYNKGDRPWMIDIPCMEAPDTHGNMWCPPL